MKRKPGCKEKRGIGKTVLRLPDLEIAKSAVLNNLSCPDAQRGYRHAIDEFVDWYCSEPRLSFSKRVVVRYRMHLETRHLAPGTINLRLGAVQPAYRDKLPAVGVQHSQCAAEDLGNYRCDVFDSGTPQEGITSLNMPALRAEWDDRLSVYDEITGETYEWGQHNYVRLEPWRNVAHIFRVERLPGA